MIGYAVGEFSSWAKDACGNEILTQDGKRCVPMESDWSAFFDKLFVRKIRPTDIDGFVEINGHHLFLEHKGSGVPIKDGQFKALLSLARKPNTTVVIINSDGPLVQPTHEVRAFSTEAWYRSPQEGIEGSCFGGHKVLTTEQFRGFLHRWCFEADKDENITAYSQPYACKSVDAKMDRSPNFVKI